VAVDLGVASPIVPVVDTIQGVAAAVLHTVDEELESMRWILCKVNRR
jgi:hypothetical protein